MTATLRTASPIVLVVTVPSVFAPFSQPSRSCQSSSMLNPPRSPPRRCTPTAGYCAWNASIAPSMSVSLIIPFISTMRIRSASFTLRLIIVTPAPSHRCVYPFRVRWTTERPKDAFVAVEYNGYWFSSPKPTSRGSQDLIFLSRFPFAGSGTSSRTTGVNPASFFGARVRPDSGAHLLDVLEDASENNLLLQRADEALGDAVGLRLADEGEAGCQAEEGQLVLEVLGQEGAAVVVTQQVPRARNRRGRSRRPG